MSYYRPSFNQANMTRGRGFSSRGYRGGSGRGGGSWGGGGGRGAYNTRGGGGRFSDSFSSGSFDSRPPKYMNERYSSRGGPDDYRKSYRMDSYSSRDGSHHRSPDRKRMRGEAPGSRHDGSYGGGGYGGGSSTRYETGYSDRRSFGSDRHQSSGSFVSRREDFRRPSGPPPPRGGGGYRGRIGSRGGGGGSRGLRSFRSDRPPPMRRRLVDSSYMVRKRIVPTRTSDFARRLKISKMRSAIAARRNKRDSASEGKEEEDEEEEEEEEEDVDAAEATVDGMEAEGEDGADGEATVKKTTAEGEAEGDVGGGDKADKEKPDKEKEKKKVKADGPASSGNKKSYIKLSCPHCGIKAPTFRRYELHIQGRTHTMAMRKVAIKQKSILSQMRMAQRNAQNELEMTTEDLAPRTNFCPLCKLNYKQRKLVHQSSEAHKNMKKFLMPYCKVCSITFESPMVYENHCCSVEHIKRKQRVENGDHSAEEFDEENNLENFTTIDSVGVDDVEEAVGEDEEGKEKEAINVGIEQIRKVDAYYCDLCKMYVGRGSEASMPPVLARHCKMRTHMQRYIRYKEDKDLEKRAEKLQRKEIAEKDKEKKTGTEEGGNADESKEDAEDNKVNAKEEGDEEGGADPARKTANDEEEARDDKLWADVDKDLDDILAKESGGRDSDEDEEVNGSERYDRFKYSEKNGDEKEQADGSDVASSDKASEAVASK